MKTDPLPRIPAYLVPGIFFLIIVLFSSQNYLLNPQYALWQWVLWNSARWLPWLLLTPFIVRLGRRFGFGCSSLRRALSIHVPACLVVSATAILMTYGLNRAGKPIFGFQAPLSFWIMAGELSHFSLVTYWLIFAGGAFYDYYCRYVDRQIAASHLETKLANGRLLVLRMKIQPHFLFNTLNAIAALVRKDPEGAERMICRLSDLLRLTLDRSAAQEIPLAQEIEIVDIYLEIMKVRFGERLAVRKEVSPEALGAVVPNFILQPLIENAIRHGISTRRGGGRVEIRAHVTGGRVHIQVEDDGPGYSQDADTCMSKGMGLSNTLERLRGLYGNDQRFELKKGAAGGALVSIEFPYVPHREVSNP